MIKYNIYIIYIFNENGVKTGVLHVVSSKWIYKIKHAANRSIEKYKAIFVARGFSQKEGIDYEETFTPVAQYTSIIYIMELAP